MSDSVQGSAAGAHSGSVGAAALQVPEQLPVEMDDQTFRVLKSLGRTEDIAVSPDGHRLALAAFNADVVAVVDLDIVDDARRPVVRVSRATFLTSPDLSNPHGLAFVDDELLVVANRHAELLVLDLAIVDRDAAVFAVGGRVIIDGETATPARTPGSVAVRTVGIDLVEVIVCNNYAHDVTRYVVDRRADWEVVDAETLLRRGLEVPDGLAVSHSGRWLAISNHSAHEIDLYRYDQALGPDSEPDGVLRGVNYPHGLRFTADDRALLVADAGLPYVTSFTSGDGDWTGVRTASNVTRVMSDESFNRGRYNSQEGGPKGIVVARKGVSLVTSEFQPLGAFLTDDLVGHDVATLRTLRPADPAGVEQASDLALRRALRSAADVRGELADVRGELADVRGELADVRSELLLAQSVIERERAEADRRVGVVMASTSWRLTSPIRRMGDIAKRRTD